MFHNKKFKLEIGKWNKRLFFSLFIVLIAEGCTTDSSSNTHISFYHWKSKAVFNESYEEAINISKTNKIYLHYFDIETKHEPNGMNDGVFPIYVLKSVATEYRKFEIVPVVYITNKVFKTKGLDVTDLSNRIQKLINQISQDQFDKEIKQIQIDCDWTESTKYAYFELLKQLQSNFTINVTIRLHQIKYKNRTGIPPVKKGTLMMYNVGDLKSNQHNSILESSIVKQYINSETDYPLALNIGLPLFSQTVITNKDHEIKIIRNAERTVLENDYHFRKTDEMNFMVVQDTLYKGFYLRNGYNLKLEELKETEIITSYQTIKTSKLIIDEIIFYHLDESTLSNVNLKELVDKL